MRRIKLGWKAGITFLAFVILLACNPIEDETKSDSLLIIERITGVDAEGNEADFLQSDVIKVNTDTGQTYVTADVAKATLRAALLNPAPLMGASIYNDILVNRYIVNYTRTDNKNNPGVDVPYPIEGMLNALVRIDQTVQVSFIVVKETAKLEPPLRNLAIGRAEGVLTVIAKIDFYGEDLAKRKVKASGYLTIEFANYTD
ncbi:MAG: hypothetical protein N3B16_13060 [Candidatus Aminicenantes bacterium]|nr:hypothetical protein [Candidatus Aminicenantes bacterium]